MSTLNKPPLPNYTVTTVRPAFGCLGGFSKINQEARKLAEERDVIIKNYHKQLENYKRSKANPS